MEAGRTIYYKGNTVREPHPNAKNRRKREVAARNHTPVETKIMPHERKVCATSVCVWCQREQRDGRYQVICDWCHTCQYCGLLNHRNDDCSFCGNMLPESLKSSEQKHIRKRRVRA